MSSEIMVILDLSYEAQMLLDQQGVDLYQELRQEVPSIRLMHVADPEASPGSRDIVTVISVTTGLVGALTPIILRILQMITPPNRSQTWIVEETETVLPDGSRTIQRKRILSKQEQHLPQPHDEQPRKAESETSMQDQARKNG
ncbi:hypothetical protein [Ktedonobacter sp. SOSP1-85]|uniref:hypothetical protein n=1 Tax=Ktedonobacter sp. SOSP1-85 TaxID=2778367 RepID=UPI0019151652|nr:hypothetical protein [Ktedonobacter sp. SOSP1-85]